jgi:integrase
MAHLTDAIIRKLPTPEKGNRITYDDIVGGLGIRITAAGARSFILNYTVRGSGKGRRYTIGSFPDWACTQAREEARHLKRLIDGGGDPLGVIEDQRGAPDMAELVERFETEHLPRLRPATAAGIRAQIRNHVLPHLGKNTKVADVRFEDVDRLHRKLSKDYPYGANRVLALCSKMFTLAIRWKMRPDNPCKGVERNDEHSRQRYLTAAEVTALTKALAEFPDQDMADIFRMLLLTGARKSEVLTMKWDDVDIGIGKWVKPPMATKANRKHEVPLSGPARQLLDKRLANKRSDHVFPSNRGHGPIGNIHRAWVRLTKDAGIDGVRVHDLRHTFASSIASGGGSLPLIGALLGHSNPTTTHRYAHLFDDAQREAVERVGAALTGKPPAEVVPLKRR